MSVEKSKDVTTSGGGGKERLSLAKFITLLDSYNIVAVTFYTIDGYIRVFEVNGKRPFMIYVPDKYLIPATSKEAVIVREVLREDSEPEDNPISSHTDTFGIATLSYPLLTVEVNNKRIIYKIGAAEANEHAKAETKIVKSSKAKGASRISKLEKDANDIRDDDVEEVNHAKISSAPIRGDDDDETGVKLVFVDSNGDIAENSEVKDFIESTPEEPTVVNTVEDEELLSMLYPAIAIDKFIDFVKKTPKRFERELTEAHDRKDTDAERKRTVKFADILARFDEWKKNYEEMNEKVSGLTQEEKKLQSILLKVSSDGDAKSNALKNLKTSHVRLSTLALRREIEIERIRLEAQLQESLHIISGTFDYLAAGKTTSED